MLVLCVRSKIGLGALALNTNIFSFSFYIFNFLATVPTPFVASARARGDADLASRWAFRKHSSLGTWLGVFGGFDGTYLSLSQLVELASGNTHQFARDLIFGGFGGTSFSLSPVC